MSLLSFFSLESAVELRIILFKNKSLLSFLQQILCSMPPIFLLQLRLPCVSRVHRSETVVQPKDWSSPFTLWGACISLASSCWKERNRKWAGREGPSQVDIFTSPTHLPFKRLAIAARLLGWIVNGSCLLPGRRLRRNNGASLSPNFGRLAVAFFSRFLLDLISWYSTVLPSIHTATESCPLLTKRRCPSSILVQACSRNFSTSHSSAQLIQKRQFRKLHTKACETTTACSTASLDVEGEIFLLHYPEGNKILQNKEQRGACNFFL